MSIKDFMRKIAEVEAAGGSRVFDWDTAARIIREQRPYEAEAGLLEDMGFTCGTIYRNGELDLESYTYLSSTWATPVLVLYSLDSDGENVTTQIPCHVPRAAAPEEWWRGVKWPDSARAILRGELPPKGWGKLGEA